MNREVDLWQSDTRNFIIRHINLAGLALHNLPLPRQLIKGHPISFDRRNHRWDLLEVPLKLIKSRCHLLIV